MSAPRLGEIVAYRLSQNDLDKIAMKRVDGYAANAVANGDVVVMVIVAVFPPTQPGNDFAVNGRVLLDGEDAPLWVTSVHEGTGVAQFERAQAVAMVPASGSEDDQ